MASPTRRAASLFMALAVFLSPLLAPAVPAGAQTGAPLLSSLVETLEATVPLGTAVELPLELRNDGANPVVPRLFEALDPAGPSASAMGATGPRPEPNDTGPAAQTRALASSRGPLIDPQIAQAQAADGAGATDLIVVLAEQADLAAAYGIADWGERGRFVSTTLQAHAEASQQELRAILDARGIAYSPFWIVNALALRATAADVAAIAAQAGVAELRASRLVELPQPLPPAQAAPATCDGGANNVCWNIVRIGANRVWDEFGVRGEGITVASIDSGVRFDHPALVAQYRGSEPGGPNHDYHWFDALGGLRAPADSSNHGTHVMGTMVARGGSPTQPAVGVAPGARWIAARACSSRECSEIDLIRAAQWLLAPTDRNGDNPRPELRPHIVNNSWTGGQSASWFASYVNAWLAAGIYPVFAAGNAGNLLGCGTIQSPGDYAQVTAVGATDSADRLTSFSSIGPTLDGRIKPDLTAPGQLIASTVADQRIYGSTSGTSMATPHVAGTVALLWSANPDLIGDYETTYGILTGSAVPMIGDPRYLDAIHGPCRPDRSPNNIYGYGRLDAYSAVALATVDVPWVQLPQAPLDAVGPAAVERVGLSFDARMVPGPGLYQARLLVHGPDLSRSPTMIALVMRVPPDPEQAVVTGRVTRARDGLPLRGTVQVVGGAAATTDGDGRYRLTLPPAREPYRLRATARDYLAAEERIALGPGDVVEQNFALAADQPLLVTDTPKQSVELAFRERAELLLAIRNEGTLPLNYSVTVPPERYGVWRSDEADGPAPSWTEPPPDAVTVTLDDDGVAGPQPIGFAFPYYHRIYETFALTANGVITLGETPPEEGSFARACLPIGETPGPAIVPLRLDLDPRAAGARVSYANLAEGLLVTWERVALYDDASRQVSFQALLMPDGRISMRYKSVGDLLPSDGAAAGLQRNAVEHQSLGCKTELSLRDGLTVELRPQVPGSLWLRAMATEGKVAPGASATIPVRIRWMWGHSFEGHFSGVVELRSNDPNTPVARFTVRLRMGEAPYTTYFPQAFTP